MNIKLNIYIYIYYSSERLKKKPCYFFLADGSTPTILYFDLYIYIYIYI